MYLFHLLSRNKLGSILLKDGVHNHTEHICISRSLSTAHRLGESERWRCSAHLSGRMHMNIAKNVIIVNHECFCRHIFLFSQQKSYRRSYHTAYTYIPFCWAQSLYYYRLSRPDTVLVELSRLIKWRVCLNWICLAIYFDRRRDYLSTLRRW